MAGFRMLRSALVLLLFALLCSEVCAAPIPMSVRAVAEEEMEVGEKLADITDEERRDGDQEAYGYTLPATQSDLYDSTLHTDECQIASTEDQDAYLYDDEQMEDDQEEVALDGGNRGLIQNSVSFLVKWLWIGAVLLVVLVCIGICMCYRLLNRYGNNLPMQQIMSKYEGYEGAMKGFM